MAYASSDEFKKIQAVLKYVWNSPYSDFYRVKYQQAGIDLLNIKNWTDFEALPFLTRKEIVDTDPYKRAFLPLNQSPDIFLSSGTTDSSNPMIIFYAPQHPLQQKITLTTPLKLKLKCILQLNPVFSSQFKMRQGYGRFRILLADSHNLALTAKLVGNLKVDGIRSTPSGLYAFLPYLKQSYDLDQIKYVFLSGEYCSTPKYEFLKKHFRKAVFEFGFASNETTHLGYRCQYLNKSKPQYFHPLPIFHYEIDDTDHRNELIVTHLFKETAFPVIKYRSGNSVIFRERACRCGNSTLMEVLGRIGFDLASFGGMMLYQKEISKSLAQIADKLSSLDYQMHIFEQIHNQTITYKLKLQLIPANPSPNLAKEIAKEVETKLFLSATLTFSNLINKGVVEPLEVEFVKTLSAQHKSRPIVLHFA